VKLDELRGWALFSVVLALALSVILLAIAVWEAFNGR
jgi:hypothetical protein